MKRKEKIHRMIKYFKSACVLTHGQTKGAGTKVRPDQLESSEKRFCKPKLFNVWTNFTKVSFKIGARVISRGLIIIFFFFYVYPR